MKAYLIEDIHSRLAYGWTDEYIVLAENEEDARQKANDERCYGIICITEIDLSAPYQIKGLD